MKIGFIGCGNMASAMIGGILRQGIFSKEDIIVSNLTPEGKARSEKNLGVVTTLDNKERIMDKDMLLIADPEKGVGVAGVMGGLNSEITPETKAVFFESAVFKASNI